MTHYDVIRDLMNLTAVVLLSLEIFVIL